MEAGAGLVSRRRGRGRAAGLGRPHRLSRTWNHGVPAYTAVPRPAGTVRIRKSKLYTSKCVPAAGCSERRGLLRGGRMA
eukprot:7772-Hanusia_phi.AAC.1